MFCWNSHSKWMWVTFSTTGHWAELEYTTLQVHGLLLNLLSDDAPRLSTVHCHGAMLLFAKWQWLKNHPRFNIGMWPDKFTESKLAQRQLWELFVIKWYCLLTPRRNKGSIPGRELAWGQSAVFAWEDRLYRRQCAADSDKSSTSKQIPLWGKGEEGPCLLFSNTLHCKHLDQMYWMNKVWLTS